ncbi:hypothetical protein GA0061078_0798 [Bifidobacterium bohemicum]|uniref:Thymidine phosphorylase n=1 Tax=Bifidobacterium bohemicum DSM 22767 TaxID=1437606 RepID=A0A086ZF38_9BIFI|nr:hypothetical protein [Bifidobacterium bohemicum]KFI45138.1 hypothetical protein BBOH_1400 [Bifidobacterium bohemicum DSM 22767]SCB90636.1 hypothetical protein GA0061078_0798 [Bifidobacterium bohemicum]
MHYSSGSVNSSHPGFSPTRLGSSRPARPAQLDPALTEKMAGGMDPEEISEMSHASAAALLDRVHHTQDPQVVQRVLTLVDAEGIDIIAELWSDSEPDSLPGILWRLYLLRTWMRNNQRSIARLWRLVESEETSASAIAGVDTPPDENDIARTADSILSGAFTGDFAVALDRASAFVDVVAKGLSFEAKVCTRRAERLEAKQATERTERFQNPESPSDSNDHGHGNDLHRLNRYDSTLSDADDRFRKGSGPVSPVGPASSDPRTAAARLLHTAGNLTATSRDFRHGADLWRRGQLE